MPLTKLAVIDDERSIRELLEIELRREGFDVRSAADGTAGFDLVRTFEPDLVLLDVMMPRIDGIALLPLLRRVTQVPIVILSAKGGVDDKVRGLERGADYYLPKPFEMQELVSMMRAAQRRPVLGDPDFLTFGDLTLKPRARLVERGGRPIALTRREFDLLAVMMREPRRVFKRDELIDAVWGEKDVSLGILDTYMSYLRAKIDGGFAEPLLHNVRGIGFALRRRPA